MAPDVCRGWSSKLTCSPPGSFFSCRAGTLGPGPVVGHVYVRYYLFGQIFFTLGCILWVVYIYSAGDSGWYHRLGLLVAGFVMLTLFTLWFLNLSNSVWLTLAYGEADLDKGYASQRQTQSLTIAETQHVLDRYINDAKGVEFTNMLTFKTRLYIIDPDETMEAEEGEQLVHLSQVSEIFAERLFDAKVYEGIELALARAAKRKEQGILLLKDSRPCDPWWPQTTCPGTHCVDL